MFISVFLSSPPVALFYGEKTYMSYNQNRGN